MIQRTLDPGFRIERHLKSRNIAPEGARGLGLSLPHAATATQIFGIYVANAGGTWDHSILVHTLEIMGNHEVA